MIALTKKISSLLFITLIAFACNKTSVEEVPYTIDLQDDFFTVTEGTQIEIDFLANDILEGEEISISLLNDVEYGELISIEGSTKYLYKAKTDFSGDDIFNYQACVNGDCKTAEVVINTTQICDPTAIADIFTTKNGELNMSISSILENDENTCSDWDMASFNLTTKPNYGAVEISNETVNFYSSSSQNWTKDEIEYEICSTTGECRKATITVMNGDNDVPTQL